MVFCVQAEFAFRNTARRDAVAANVETRLAQAVTWGEVAVTTGTRVEGDPQMAVVVRFETEAEADSFWADVQAAVGSGVNGPLTGSAIRRHDCPHDEGAGACVVSEGRSW